MSNDMNAKVAEASPYTDTRFMSCYNGVVCRLDLSCKCFFQPGTVELLWTVAGLVPPWTRRGCAPPIILIYKV